jgi:hypothetical protein
MFNLKNLDFPEGALVVCAGLALLFGLMAVLSRWEDDSFVRHASRAEGEITGVQQRIEIVKKEDSLDRKKHWYLPKVTFRTASGKTVVFEGRYETLDENRWKTGVKVPVLYSNENPSVARVDDPSQVYAAQRVWVIVMIGSIVVGALLFGVAKIDEIIKNRPRPLTGEEARRAYFGEHE